MTEMQKITPTEHSDLVGGSTAARVLACPKSVTLVRAAKRAHKERILQTLIDNLGLSPSLTFDNMPALIAEQVETLYREETSSSYSAEGTALHEAMAWILENDEESESVVDREFEGHYITMSLYGETVKPALDAFDSYLDKVVKEDGQDLEFKVEERGELKGIAGAYGTSDVFGKTDQRLAIIDWKFGNWAVTDPTQLVFYASALAHTFKDWVGQIDPDHPVDLVIVQPRRNGVEPKIFEFTWGAIEDFRLELIAAVENALSDKPRMKKGSHCKWCEAKEICPAQQYIAGQILERVNGAVERAEEIEPVESAEEIRAAINTDLADFTPEDLAQWLEDVHEIEEWCDAVKLLAFREAQAGRVPPGMKLVHGRSTVKWAGDYASIDRRLADLGLKVADRRRTKHITPKQAEALLKDDETKIKKLHKSIEETKGPIKLVPSSAKGEPIQPHKERLHEVGAALKDHIE